MFDNPPEPLPDSPHQRMLDFLAESDAVTAHVVPTDPDWDAMIDRINRVLENEDGMHLIGQDR
ncbi:MULTISPECIES: hypothetical protein [Streptomyces]|uniref:Uncharacterized protein n=1 Tax=Streptomyces venetus TaxID=1701086 RepID=A0ABP8HLT7_9ACTN|nr:hypothetical protein [Streptomyces sp. NRRL F-5650]